MAATLPGLPAVTAPTTSEGLSEAAAGVDSLGLIMRNHTAVRVYFIGWLRAGHVGHESEANDAMSPSN